MYSIEDLEIRDSVARPMRLPQGALLRVVSGRVWLTREGGSEDIWLSPGQEWQASTSLRVWLSAEPVARLQRLSLVPHGADARPGGPAWRPLAASLAASLRQATRGTHGHRPPATEPWPQARKVQPT